MKLTLKKMKKKKGFTLIELMVVISIILVLASFLVPKLTAYKDKAKDTKAINTGKQIQVAAINSYNENNESFNSNNLKEDIETFTGIKVDSASESKIGEAVDVAYKSDNENYIVEIDLEGNSYSVKKDNKTIFPK
ncbi:MULTISPECIES: type II secretion system protein [Clostridium]|uniref:Pilin n=1 Tax=Clostridium sporogenes TaxID=1509 RepID=A0ABX4K6U1_CLOSG|nr:MULTISPECIES: type II secretion system protein [Clostridium]MBW5456755.1 prepilin-type N-terminal cleavage/methylation domain-containing protein [Clostridium sporogenes]MDU7253907.1 type II secretion system protein [Clostridium sp.]NFF63773.1 type II secretion system protein [Clostridium sporogenes]NFH46075.1 type II secretion system protein [Clostridium sporogenes]NFQ01387.1 type II secretion system protein [Clostridium sporogenes]